MEIVLCPRIIDDNQTEIKENELAMIQTTDMTEPALAMITEIQTTFITFTFADAIFGNIPQTIRASAIKSIRKA